MALISADRFIALKAEVKAECQRRSYTGSVSSYGGTEYDYSVTPASGGTVLKEHYTKIAEPLNAITGDVDVVPDIVNEGDLAILETKVLALNFFFSWLRRKLYWTMFYCL